MTALDAGQNPYLLALIGSLVAFLVVGSRDGFFRKLVAFSFGFGTTFLAAMTAAWALSQAGELAPTKLEVLIQQGSLIGLCSPAVGILLARLRHQHVIKAMTATRSVLT
jgi:hypothetical protein